MKFIIVSTANGRRSEMVGDKAGMECMKFFKKSWEF